MSKLTQLLDIATNNTNINDYYEDNGYESPYSVISYAIRTKGSDTLYNRVHKIVVDSCTVGWEGLSSFGCGLLSDSISLLREMEHQANVRGLNVHFS